MLWIFFLAVIAAILFGLLLKNAVLGQIKPSSRPEQGSVHRSSGAELARGQARGPAATPSTTPTLARPRTVSQRATSARWISPGETVEVAGLTLPGGMLYVGSGLQPVKKWALDVEPALLDSSLQVDRRSEDFEGRLMPYWPSYSKIPPACRFSYLQWLARGRNDPAVGVGYVFLFFYGLERRLLFDSSRAEVSPAEVDEACTEIARLLSIYENSHSFRRYASTFLDLGSLLRRTVNLDDLKPPLRRNGWDLPIATRLALGIFAAQAKPLPPEWAHSWIVTAPEVSLRTPALRCPEEFRELFQLRYQETFGDGLRLHQNKTRLKIDYQPASPSFGGPVTLAPDLPDASRSVATLDRLRELADQCTQELDPFSRWVGRTGEKASPPAIALLPAPLARGRGNETTRALEDWLERQIAGRELALVEAADLITQWPSKEAGRPTRRELETFSDFLASRGFGIEPDVALGGTALTRCQRVCLFRLTGNTRESPSAAYRAAAVLLNLAAAVASADGGVSESEELHLTSHLEGALNLPRGDRARLEAHFRWLASAPPSLSALKRNLEDVPQDGRQGIGVFLISLAGADGHLAPAELKVLSKIYPLLGLDPQSLYTDMHKLMSAQTAPSDYPVVVRPEVLPEGYALPRPPRATISPAIELDPEKVREKLAETERVSLLLGEIFSDEEEAVFTSPALPAPATDDFAIAGLDGAHSALLLRLGGSASWERAQVERLAHALGLLPDGALEAINEAAFNAYGAALLEGDERIEIDQEILQEILR